METVQSGFLWEVGWELKRVELAEARDCAFHDKTCTLQFV